MPTAAVTAPPVASDPIISDTVAPAPAQVDPTTPPSPEPPQPTDTAAPAPTASPTTEQPPTEAPSTAAPAETSAPAATDLSLVPDDVVLHPVPTIYAGDKVTFQLLPHVPDSLSVNDVLVSVLVDDVAVAGGPLERRNWSGQAEGIYEWAWDTTGQQGEHRIRVELDPADAIQAGDEDPANNVVEFTVTVHVAAALGEGEAAATWETTEVNCCVVHVVSNTAAARDLPEVLATLERAVAIAASRLDLQPSQKLHVYFIDRVVGQGGFAGTDMVVSYVDRRYAGGGLHELLVHEAVHILDQQFAPQRISFLAEGLAVWASGGHYKLEDLTQRSVALLALGRYIPLTQLIDDFYPVQHEIGYLEAAGLVSYLIERGGWSTFKEFYAEVSGDDADTLSGAVDLNLQRFYGATLEQIESEWLAMLQAQPVDPVAMADLAATIRYYDVARRYQEVYDPTAHYLNAWLPHPTEVREFGNPADLNRRPEDEMNITLEVMLEAADRAVRVGDYEQANVILDSITRILDNGGQVVDPMATAYLQIVRAAGAFGYELHQVDLQGDRAVARATQAPSINLTNLTLSLRGQEWVILSH